MQYRTPSPYARPLQFHSCLQLAWSHGIQWRRQGGGSAGCKPFVPNAAPVFSRFTVPFCTPSDADFWRSWHQKECRILNADFQKFSGVTPLGWGTQTRNSYSALCAPARTTFSAANAGACDSLLARLPAEYCAERQWKRLSAARSIRPQPPGSSRDKHQDRYSRRSVQVRPENASFMLPTWRLEFLDDHRKRFRQSNVTVPSLSVTFVHCAQTAEDISHRFFRLRQSHVMFIPSLSPR